MADNRTNRDLTARDKQVRYEYKPSSTLPDPTPIPGVSFRWIMTHILGVADATNSSRKFRDGWEPVKAADHPELMLKGNTNGNVEIGGLILCSMPTERLEAQTRYFENLTKSQMESVDNSFMQDNHPNMRKFSEKTSSTSVKGFGSGTR